MLKNFLIIAVLSFTINATAQNISNNNITSGDVNSDGAVDISDVLLTVDYILGKPSDSFVQEAADMNHDEVIDISDVLLIVDKILGREDDNEDDGTPPVDDGDNANPNLPVLAPRK